MKPQFFHEDICSTLVGKDLQKQSGVFKGNVNRKNSDVYWHTKITDN